MVSKKLLHNLVFLLPLRNKGDLGWISSKSLSKSKIIDIIEKMNIGDISKPIIKQNTILFLKLNDKRKSKIDKVNLVN